MTVDLHIGNFRIDNYDGKFQAAMMRLSYFLDFIKGNKVSIREKGKLIGCILFHGEQTSHPVTYIHISYYDTAPNFPGMSFYTKYDEHGNWSNPVKFSPDPDEPAVPLSFKEVLKFIEDSTTDKVWK